MKGEDIINAEKLHHFNEKTEKEKEASEILKKTFTYDKIFDYDFFPSS